MGLENNEKDYIGLQRQEMAGQLRAQKIEYIPCLSQLDVFLDSEAGMQTQEGLRHLSINARPYKNDVYSVQSFLGPEFEKQQKYTKIHSTCHLHEDWHRMCQVASSSSCSWHCFNSSLHINKRAECDSGPCRQQDMKKIRKPTLHRKGNNYVNIVYTDCMSYTRFYPY